MAAGLVLAPVVSTLGAAPASAAPSAVGSLATNSGIGVTTLNVDPQTVGDVLAVAVVGNNSSISVSSVSGGGVSHWTRALQYDGVNEPRDLEMWYGTITTTGSATATFTWSGPFSGLLLEYNAQEFTAGLGANTAWSVAGTAHLENSSSTTVTYPSLTPSGSGEVYYGFTDLPEAPSAGSTAGFTYVTAAEANQVAYDPSVSSTVQPTSGQSPADVSTSVAMLLSASGGGGSGITPVGGLTSKTGTALTSISVAPQAAGDLLAVFAELGTTGVTVSSMSGGGTTAWSKAVQFTANGVDTEIWYGKVAAPGTATLSVTWSGSVAGHSTEYGAQEFRAGAGSGATWSLDKTGTENDASSAAVALPALTPAASAELYFGYAEVANTASAGSTSGFTFAATSNGNEVAYDPSVSSAVAPSATQSPAGVSTAVGALFVASGTAAAVPTVTSVSANAGTTAGGTAVTITGTGFTGATAVDFGGTAAASYTVSGSTSISATTPAEPAWTADVTVTTPQGTSATSPADEFTFQAAMPTAVTTPHVMEIMMENESGGDILGNPQAHNINQLAQDYGSATQSFAVGHPSEPNYLELIGGSTFGVTSDNTPAQAGISSSATTIANQLEAAGIPWRGYFESMPSAGYTGGDTGGTDPYGGEYYLQHHNPFVYFPAVTSLPDFSSDVVPMTSAAAVASGLNAANAPSFVWVTPNAVDDMHDGPMLPDGDTVPTVGDAWIGNFIGTVQATSWYAAGGQIIIDWDEGAESDTSGFGPASPGDGGHIPTVVVSNALAQHPQQDATSVNTAGVLHSVEKTFGLPYLSDAANSANGNIDSLMTFTAPAVTGVQPNAGPATGGTSVTVTGTGFTGAAVVDFGSHAGSTVSVGAGGTSLTVTAPAQSAGTVDVTVTTPSGTSATSSADLFTYGGTPPPTPTVMGVSPSSGSTGGGTPVTVTGSNFTGATAVHFGTTAATSFSVTNSTTISVSSPPGSGTVDVTVTTPGGTSATSSADRFTYTGATSPSITAVGGFSSKTGTALTTLAVTPAAAGDVLVVFAEAATTGTVSSVTGGGVASWTKAVQFSANGVDTEIWFGKVTTTGSSTVTFAWSSSLSGHSAEYGDQEFSAGLGSSTVWALDKSGTKNNASSTSVALPALTPTGAGELYFGYGEVANTASAGTTAGFTFAATSNGNLAAYDPSVSGAVSPVGAQAPAGVSTAVGVLLVAS